MTLRKKVHILTDTDSYPLKKLATSRNIPMKRVCLMDRPLQELPQTLGSLSIKVEDPKIREVYFHCQCLTIGYCRGFEIVNFLLIVINRVSMVIFQYHD